jgi:phospholipid/cholesterol/gamma-HCH transport system permease protein
MSAEPTFATEVKGDTLLVSFFGDWTITQPKTESQARALSSKAANTATATFDLSEVAAIDTAGAWLIDRCRVEINQRGGQATFAHASDEHSILLKEAHWRKFEQAPIKHGSSLIGMLADIGQTLTSIFQDFAYGFAFLGEVVASLIRLLLHPMRRSTSSSGASSRSRDCFNLPASARRHSPWISSAFSCCANLLFSSPRS